MTAIDIKKINTDTLKKILIACEKSFPKELNVNDFYGKEQTTWSIPEIGIVYKNTTSKNDLLTFVETITETENIRLAYAKIYKEVEIREIESKKEKPKEADRPKEQDKTTLNKEESKQLQEEQVARETKRKNIISKSDKEIEEALKRKQEIFNEKAKLQKQVPERIKAVQKASPQVKIQPSKPEIFETGVVQQQKKEIENTQRTEEINEQINLLNKNIEESIKIDPYLRDDQNIDKKIYAKVEVKETPKFTEDEKNAFELYKEEAKIRPKETLEDLAKTIEERVAPTLKSQGLSDEEIKFTSKQTATKIVENITELDSPSYVSPITQFKVLDEISKDEKVVPKIFKKVEVLQKIKNLTNDTAVTKGVPDFVAKNVTTMAFGESFSSTVFGVDESKIEVTLSETPQEAFSNSINFYDLNQNYKQSLDSQNSTLESVKDLRVNETKGFFYKKAGTLLNDRIAILSPNSVAGKLLQSTEVKSLFYSTFGVGSPVEWKASGWVGNLALKFAPESAPILSGISKLTGINFGISPIISTITAEAVPIVVPVATEIVTQTGAQIAGKVVAQTAVQTAGKVGIITTAKTAISALASKIGATALGSWLPIIGHAIGAAIGWLFGKIIEKINWKKVKEYLLPVLGIGGGLLIGGPIGITMVVGGGLFAAGAFRSVTTIGGFFAKLGIAVGSLTIRIATPVIIALLIIPPIVALFMFIINSGAYMVPPGGFGSTSGTLPTECQGEAPPKPNASGIMYSDDGKYAYPLAFANSVGEDCTHWDGSLATDMFPTGGEGTHLPVVAYTSGTIYMISMNDSKGGKYIILEGNDKRYYYYAHNCHLYVTNNQKVSAGDVIATSDSSGSAAGTPEHLHFAISNFPNFFHGGTLCPSTDFDNNFSSYSLCSQDKQCVR